MKRINLVSVVTVMMGALAFVVGVPVVWNVTSSSATVLQTPTIPPSLRRIRVNSQTLATLPTTRKYVVDLTQRGVIYEFDHERSRIDFNRVTVRTEEGESALGSFMTRTFVSGLPSRFNYASQSFSLGTHLSGTVRNTTVSQVLACGKKTCVCSGLDCIKLIFDDGYCGGPILCSKDESTGVMWCYCDKKQ